jgi:hypothetical protein
MYAPAQVISPLSLQAGIHDCRSRNNFKTRSVS